jgi:hypothetical protein
MAYEVCAASGQGADLSRALAAVDEGIAAFPRAASFRQLKATVYLTGGKTDEALRFYNEAIDLAEANIKSDSTGLQTNEDRDTLRTSRDAVAKILHERTATPPR